LKQLYCINKNDNIELYGQDRDYQQRILILYVPCTPNNQTNSCMSYNFNDFLNYLKAPSLVVLSNNMRFDSSIFEDGKALIKESIYS
jgi:hypothetical protein